MEKYDEIFKIMKLFGKDARRSDGSSYNFDLTDEHVLRSLLGARDRVTPAYITSLDEDEVFVFGSNVQGFHGGRASKMALLQFGAKSYQGEGLFGRSYALPTTDFMAGGNGTLTVEEIREHVNKFINKAKERTDLKFMVTRVGCGFSGLEDEDVAPLFTEALVMENVYLPQSFLDVLFEVETPFDNPSKMVPTKSRGIETFASDLWRQLSFYTKWLRDNKSRFVGPVFESHEFLSVMDKVERINASIIEAVELTYRGLPSSAYKALESVLNKELLWESDMKENLYSADADTVDKTKWSKSLFDCKDFGLQSSISMPEPNHKTKKQEDAWGVSLLEIEKNKTFYRMRSEQDNMKKQTVDCRGMFHIGFSNRGIVKTQRYSVPGYPCLYMGEHIYGCWVELGKPNLSDCLISKLKNEKPFYVLDLSIPKPEAWEITDKKKLRSLMLTFPLIIASSFKQFDTKAYFKPEYIVPQLLLQYVKELAFEHNKKVASKDKKVVYGIKYTSVHIPKEGEETELEKRLKGDNLFCNYVVPVVDIKNELCTKLADIFKISEPICEEFEMVRLQSGKDVFDTLEEILETTRLEKIP